MSSISGQGGGPLYSSTLIAFGSLSKQALPIAKTIIFFGSFVLMILNILQQNDDGTPKIMWDIVFYLETIMMIGVQLGAIINDALPEWFLQLASFIFFFYTFVKMTRKSIEGIKKDRQLLKSKKNVTYEDLLKAEKDQMLQQRKINIDEDMLVGDNPNQQQINTVSTIQQPNVESVISKDKESLPLVNSTVLLQKKRKFLQTSHLKLINPIRMINLIVIVILTTVLAIIRAEVSSCSTSYWLLFAFSLIFGIIAVIINDRSLHRSLARKETNIFLGCVDDTMLSIKNRIKYGIYTLIAGIVCSALAIGGALFMMPLLLSMGIPTTTTRLASSTMVSLTAFTSMVQYTSLGLVNFAQSWIYDLCAAILYPLGFFSSTYLMKLIKSTSVIQLFMAICMLISTIFVGITCVQTIIDMIDTKQVDGFNDICR